MGESGYGEVALSLLSRYNAGVFDRVRVHADGEVIEGILLPRPGYGDPDVLVLKLDNGYNIGVDSRRVSRLEVLYKYEPRPLAEPRPPRVRKGLPLVHVLGTGGTIASRVDYQTGAVYPYFTAEEIYSMIPEVEEVAVIRATTLFNIFSEDMTPSHWARIAEEVGKVFEREGPRGVVVAHGTDTMAYTAAALAFALRRLPGPVVLVGAQRSSDRPSSDTALNVLAAVETAVRAPFGESVIVMHGSVDDDYCLAHRGVKARKMHTSRRDAFRSVNDLPLALIRPLREFRVINERYIPRSEEGPVVEASFDERTALVKFYPGMPAEVLEFFIDKEYHGLVVEGTGLGHVARRLIPTVQRAVEEGVAVVIASQCIWGRVNMNVYRTGVELLKAGAIPAGDMLPETAFVKLSWVLARTRDLREVRELMLADIAHEHNPRSEARYYPPVYEVG